MKSGIHCGAWAALLLALASAGQAWAAEPIRADGKWNSPPKERLNEFDRFELRQLAVGARKAKEQAVDGLRRNLQKELGRWVGEKNALPARHDPPRLLRIEPTLEDVRLVGGGGRFWLGPLLGSSRILLRLRLVDADSGQTVAEPEFYQRAGAWSGGATLGVMDKAMLVRVARLSAGYLEANYSTLVGGAMADESATDESAPDQLAAAADAPSAGIGTSPVRAYRGDSEEAARNLAASRNCYGRLVVSGKDDAGTKYSASCWGSQSLKIVCAQGACQVAP